MKKKLLIIFLAIIPLIPIVFWLPELTMELSSGEIYLPYAGYLLVRVFALVGFVLLSYQFLSGVRLPIVERIFPRGSIIVKHRLFGKIGFLLVLVHGIMMLVFDVLFSGSIYLFTAKVLGIIGLFILAAAVVAARFFKSMKLSFRTWKTIHLLAFPAFLLLFLHAVSLGSTVVMHRPVFVLFYALFFLYAGILVYRITVLLRGKHTR